MSASSEMVAILEWVNGAPDADDSYGMNGVGTACPYQPRQEEGGVAPEVPFAVLLCQDNSHPFQKRTLLLHREAKIGRSVAKTKPDANNAIFDCKVLSRHHAALWCDGGRFFLKDTKSSNGTFVNNCRLSEGSKDSEPYEVSSGDIVQFGVEVVEHSGSVTHGCIIAMLKLYLANGKEAKIARSSLPMHQPSPSLDELQLLNKIIQEASEREYILEEKLNSLRKVVESCRDAADASWHAQVCEDHLLCRINFLERRLAALSSNAPPTELQQLLEDKYKYEVTAKESLRQAQEERLKLIKQICTLEWSLCSTEDECTAQKNSADRAHDEYMKLCTKYASLEQKLKTAQHALRFAESKLAEEKQNTKDCIMECDECLDDIMGVVTAQAQSPDDELSQIFQCVKSSGKSTKREDENVDSDKSNMIIDNKNLEDIDCSEPSLPELIRGLPDYILAILPDHVLKKVGCKSLKTSTLVEELHKRLYCFSNELEKGHLESETCIEDDINENATLALDNIIKEAERDLEESANDEFLMSIPDADSEDTKMPSIVISDCSQNNLNEEMPTSKENIENESCIDNLKDEDNFLKKLLKETKKLTIEETAADKEIRFLKDEMCYAKSKISALRDKKDILKGRVVELTKKIEEFKYEKEKLLFEKTKIEKDFSEKAELCSTLEMHLSHLADREKSNEASNIKYKEVATDLQNRLTRTVESEAIAIKQMKELNVKIYELQKRLEDATSEIKTLNDRQSDESLKTELNDRIESLHTELASKERQVVELQKKVSILTEMQVALEEKLAEIKSESIDDRLWDHQSAYSSDETTSTMISVDSKRLSELEEELVITKEKWAHVNNDRTQLQAELQNMTEKFNRLASQPQTNILIYVIPFVAVLIYVLVMHQSVS